MSVTSFMRRHFRHFNAGTLVAAADAYTSHVRAGGKVLVSLAGAMSTARLGISLAEMIRRGFVHAISCTGANLEEDVFSLVARDTYRSVPSWRELSREQEQAFHDQGLNRVTDTLIPEQAFDLVAAALVEEWRAVDRAGGGEACFPHEYLYRILRSGALAERYQVDPCESWLLAAAEADLPMVVPGWEDSTLGIIFAAHVAKGEVSAGVVRSGVEYMTELSRWYTREAREMPLPPAPSDRRGGAVDGAGGTAATGGAAAAGAGDEATTVGSLGFLQIGGGIAGDFAISVAPTVRELLGRPELPRWGYFCQISDAPTSYGGYSGAPASEKITWGKLAPATPSFVIESDATIVAPLLFAHVLGW